MNYIVRRRNDNRVIAVFPHGIRGKELARMDALRRNKSPDSSLPPYFPDELAEGEPYRDKNGIWCRHTHEGS